MNAKVMMMNQIRRINKKTGEIELPIDYNKRPSLKQMRDNEAKLKELEKELNNQKMEEHITKNQEKHNYYRTHGEQDMDFEEWEKLSKEQKDKLEEDRKLKSEIETKSAKEYIDVVTKTKNKSKRIDRPMSRYK